MEQKQKIKKRVATMSSKGAADSTADSSDAFKHSPSKQGVPLLQKTFSLGEAT